MKKIKLLIYVVVCLTLFFSIENVNAEKLKTGNYTITTALNENKVVDLSGGMAKNSNIIQLYDSNNSKAQTWHLEKDKDGYYTITTAVNTNYAFDVNSGIFKNLSKVQLYKKNNTKAQKWQLIEDENGYYTIASYNGKYVLDISGASAINGRALQLYENNGTKAQKFIINKKVEGKKEIEDGVYSITTKDDKYALDIDNANMSNFSNIKISQTKETKSQKWYIKYLGNGYYSIKSLININYSLDVSGGSKLRKTNIQLYTSNNSEAQQWIIRKKEIGTYQIISRKSGYALEIENKNYKDNNNIYLNTDDENEYQEFKLNKIENFGDKTIEDGYYFINTKLNYNKSLDVYSGIMNENSNVQLYDSNSTLAQKWYIKYLENGYYSILSNKDSNFALTSETGEESNIKINTFNNSDTQKWVIKDNGNGYYSILNKSYLAISLENMSTVNFTNIILTGATTSDWQQFKLIPTSEGVSEKVLENGYYFINSALNENYVLDLAGASTKNGADLQLYSLNSTKAQKWYLTYIDNGYYRITSSLSSLKTLDVYAGRTTDGTNVQLFDYNGSYAQQWIIKDAGDGYFYIVSNCNGLYLDVDNGAAINSANIEVNSFTGNTSQKFKFTKTRLENLVIDVSAHQGQIDWNQVKNSGIYGVILRISAGCDYEDSMFSQYISEVKRLQIPYGIYIFSYAENYNEGVLYGKFTQNMINKYNLNPTLGIYLDLENTPITSYMGTNEYTQVVQGYMSVIPSAKIYCDLNHANGILNTDYIRPYITWIAQWSSQCSYTSFYKMWQFTSDGSIPGINGRVDLSYYYLD